MSTADSTLSGPRETVGATVDVVATASAVVEVLAAAVVVVIEETDVAVISIKSKGPSPPTVRFKIAVVEVAIPTKR